MSEIAKLGSSLYPQSAPRAKLAGKVKPIVVEIFCIIDLYGFYRRQTHACHIHSFYRFTVISGLNSRVFKWSGILGTSPHLTAKQT